MSTTKWILLVAANIPAYLFLGWIFFKDWDDFGECIRYSLTPDIVSLFRGEYWDDERATFKLWFWLLACAGCVLAEAHYFLKVF